MVARTCIRDYMYIFANTNEFNKITSRTRNRIVGGDCAWCAWLDGYAVVVAEMCVLARAASTHAPARTGVELPNGLSELKLVTPAVSADNGVNGKP